MSGLKNRLDGLRVTGFREIGLIIGYKIALVLYSIFLSIIFLLESEVGMMEKLLDDFTKMHNEFINDWAIAMSTGDTTSIERIAADYYVAFFKSGNEKPLYFTREEAISGMKQSVTHFLGAEKKFENRVIRLRDEGNAVVFYEQLIVRDEKVLARLFTIENWNLENGKWVVIREIEEAI